MSMIPNPIRAAAYAAALAACSACPLLAQEALPAQLAGTWRIARALPTKSTGCWESAGSLVGSTLTYRPTAMRWRGGVVPLQGVVTRTLTTQDFEKESASTFGTPLRLADLNIQAPHILEVDLQHEDADITGSTTEVPGDSILLAGRNTIVVSACGSFFEATRISPTAIHPAAPTAVAEVRTESSARPSSRMDATFARK